MKKISEWEEVLREALRSAGKYSPGLEPQIMSLAGALRTLDLVNHEIDAMEQVLVPVVSRYGNETHVANPCFKIQKDAQESITKQMKALGLTPDDLMGTDRNDPLIELTDRLVAIKQSPRIVRPVKK